MPMTIDFVDASEGVIETYGWDFGDGDSSILEDPSHTYADPLAASYDVLHYVAGDKGMDSITKTITVPTFTVVAGLTADINADPALNLVFALDFLADVGDCGSFTVGKTVDGTFADSVSFDCADLPTLTVYLRGVQTGTGLVRIIPATLEITDTGGVCP